MKYILTLLLSLIMILPVEANSGKSSRPAPAQSTTAPKSVDIKGKVVKKNIVVKDSAGRKKICNKVLDKKTKKEYLVCN